MKSATKLLPFLLLWCLDGCSDPDKTSGLMQQDQAGAASNVAAPEASQEERERMTPTTGIEESKIGATPLSPPSKQDGIQQVQPDAKSNIPAPEMSQEERERMIRRTEIEETKPKSER